MRVTEITNPYPGNPIERFHQEVLTIREPLVKIVRECIADALQVPAYVTIIVESRHVLVKIGRMKWNLDSAEKEEMASAFKRTQNRIEQLRSSLTIAGIEIDSIFITNQRRVMRLNYDLGAIFQNLGVDLEYNAMISMYYATDIPPSRNKT